MKKGNTIRICSLVVIALLLALIISCKKGKNALPDPIPGENITDVDGNVYKTVKIGAQWWMAENLKTTRYNDGSAIPLVPNDTVWKNLSAPGYCWYDNDSAVYKNIYGALYNWYTVNTRKLAPAGWHVPTDDEWSILIDYLEEYGSAGGLMKEAGTAHWRSPNTGADNSSGFMALPGGYRTLSGDFGLIGEYTSWWSSKEDDNKSAFTRDLSFNNAAAYRHSSKKFYGFSVRCVKD